MAKVTLTDITSGYQGQTAYNANNQAIEDAFDDMLSRKGTSPNAMEADIDLNSNDLLNVSTVAAQSITVNGVSVVPGDTLTVPDAVNVPFTPAGTGAVATNVSDYLKTIRSKSLEDFGFSASNTAAENDTALTNAITEAKLSGGGLHLITEGTYLISAKQTVSAATGLLLYIGPDALIQSSVAGDYTFEFVNCVYTDLHVRLQCTDSTAKGINFKESTGNSLYNKVNGVLFGPGRAATKPSVTAGTVGINFESPVGGQSNYFNEVSSGMRISGWDHCIYKEHLANANRVINPNFDAFWYGITTLADEGYVSGGFWHQSSGSGADEVECVHVGDTAQPSIDPAYNQFIGCMYEPGSLARPLVMDRGFSNTFIHTSNLGLGVTNNSTGNNFIMNRGAIDSDHVASFDGLITTAEGINDVNTSTADEYSVSFFGDGTNAQTGTGQQKVRVFGVSNQTRHIEVYQTSGNAIIDAVGSDLDIYADGTRVANFNDTVTSGQTGMYLLYHNGTTTTLQQVTLGAIDSGGTGFKVLRVPN